MLVAIPVRYADVAHLSRVDHSSMTTQSLMELLVSNILNISRVKDANEKFLDIEEWNGIYFNAAEEVHAIHLSKKSFDGYYSGDEPDNEQDEEPFTVGPGGNIDLRWLPSSVTEFEICMLNLDGTIETSEFPRGMQSLNISENKFTGTFNMETLSSNFSHIRLKNNSLEGCLDMTHAPPSLEHFDARYNLFSGSLVLTELPSGMTGKNDFSGEIDLSKLPCGLKCLQLNKNNFSQDRLIVTTPEGGFYFFSVDCEKFGQIADQHGRRIAIHTLYGEDF